MTVKEYNKEFLPKIIGAKNVIESMEQEFLKVKAVSEAGYNQCMTELKCLGWNEDVKNIALEALEYYRIHEGIEKICYDDFEKENDNKKSLKDKIKKFVKNL